MTQAPERERRLHLLSMPQSARQARQEVRAALEECGRPDLSEDAELAVSEIVTNALLHAHTEIDLLIRADAAGIRVEVRDYSALLPAPRAYDSQATTGRGLGLVSLLATSCGIEVLGGSGKAVWFVISGPVGGPADRTGDSGADVWAVHGEAADPVDVFDVVLRELPVNLWLAAQQHHDAIRREHALYLAEQPGAAGRDPLTAGESAHASIAAAVQAEIDRAKAAGVELNRLPLGHPGQVVEAPRALTVRLAVASAMVPDFAALQDTLDAAEALAAADALLVRPALPEIVAVRDWVCEQVIAQVGGVLSAPWPGTDHEKFTRREHDRFRAALPDWDNTVVREATRAVVAADDNNRIAAVSLPAAEMLGWTQAELTGQRVVTIIPPRLREAHVAGFSRHLTTGVAHALGVELDLPVLHRDGSEVMCRFMVERTPASRGRAVYLAWLTPL